MHLTKATAEGVYEPLSIMENLHSALQHLRNENESRPLWVDAICINQFDIIERNRQVSRIAAIFQSAGRAIAWLGEPDTDSRLAMDTLQYLGKQMKTTQNRRRLGPPDADEPTWHLRLQDSIRQDRMECNKISHGSIVVSEALDLAGG